VTTTVSESARADANVSATAIFQDISDSKRLQLLHVRAERLQAVAELSASLAHEIRNPLASIRSATEQLARFHAARVDASADRQDDDEGILHGLVVREADRLSRLLADFLDFARQESLTLEPGSLNEELGQLLDFFGPQAQEAGVEIVRYLDPELPLVRLDRETFRSAVLNLLINSLQAMESGGQLVVRTRPAGLGVVLELIDNGAGMDEQTLAKAFRAFYTTKQGGSGLGLPTARKIVEAHGGTIDVESAPGRGTRVTVRLGLDTRVRLSPVAGRIPSSAPRPGAASAPVEPVKKSA
jgi:two-component system sensor histidine kinase PilS (NtrC family)